MSRNRLRYRNAKEALDAVLAIPSDDESDDDEECSDDEVNTADDLEVSEHPGVAGAEQSSEDDSDDDILYHLPTSDSDCSVEPDTGSDSESESAEPVWQKKIFREPDIDFDCIRVVPQQPFLPTDSPVDFFEKFFTEDVFQNLATQTNVYAQQCKLRYWTDTCVREMKAYVGMLIGMGLHSLPQFRLYWSSDPLFRVQPLSAVMSRRRFLKLLQALHVNDNTKAPQRGTPEHDKLYKLRPLLDNMNSAFMHHAVSSSSQSIDEGMVQFKGRNTMKQYMPMKPVKRGYKLWIRADAATGYVYHFQVYTGRNDSDAGGVGLAARVVQKLTEAIHFTYTHVAFDNYFSSVDLLTDLLQKNLFATCTVRSNRRGLPEIASQSTNLTKGQSEWMTKSRVAYIKWMDTKCVHVLSTAFDPNATLDVSRKQKDGTRLTVTCPKPVYEYTKRMGGVDRFDQRRSMYSVSRRSRKWWMRLLYFVIDAAVVNAYILYTSVHPDETMTMFNFRLRLFRGLVGTYSSRSRKSFTEGVAFIRRPRSRGRDRKSGVPDELRLDHVGNHMPDKISSFRRCRHCSSKKNNKRSRYICRACGVPLCITPCFAEFHK